VDGSGIVPKFGEKAKALVDKTSAIDPQLGLAVDGALRALFLRQVALLRHQTLSKFQGGIRHINSAGTADQEFVEAAKDLICAGSDWSYETERLALRASLDRVAERDAALAEERARAARAQQVTIDAIGKLQDQMEHLQQKAQGMRGGGSPWVLSTSYRIPRTPLQVVGRYENGRANVELNLTPDKNPSNSEASFAEGIGPVNIGASFNLGL